jgi:hypothetical protein
VNGPGLLAPTDLDDHPELAVLAVAREAAAITDLALVAAHPRLVGDDPDDPVEHAANAVLHAAASLRAAIDAYCEALEREIAAP